LLLYILSVEAATKIQAAFRGHRERAKMQQGDGDHSDHEPTKEELEAEFDLNDEGMLASIFHFFFCSYLHLKKILFYVQMTDQGNEIT